MKPIEFSDFLNTADAGRKLAACFAMEENSSAAPNRAAATGPWPRSTGGQDSGVIHQNIDNLHQSSGIAADEVVGVARQHDLCGLPRLRKNVRIVMGEASLAQSGGRSPECTICDGYIKTATVSFGQSMPEAAMRARPGAHRVCDLFLAIGSSLVVWPAADSRWPPNATARASSSSTGTRRSSTKSPISCCMMTSARCSRHSSHIDSLPESYSQGPTRRSKKTHLVLFHGRECLSLMKRFAGQRPPRDEIQGQTRRHGVGQFPKGLGLGPQEVGDVSDETATVVELSGVIKWFDVSKG